MYISMAFLAWVLFFTFGQALTQAAKKRKYSFLFKKKANAYCCLFLNQTRIASKRSGCLHE